MESTLGLLYEYVRDLEHLIAKAEEFSKKKAFHDVLSRFYPIEDFNPEDLNIYESEHLVSLSRILANYGFSQTYESFENACLFLLVDYNLTKMAVDMATAKLKRSASRLYSGKPETTFLWRAYETEEPWVLFVNLLAGSDNEAAARRYHYSERLTALASPKNLANIQSFKEIKKIATNLSPLYLELDFIANDGILPEVLSLHTNKTDLN